MPSPLDRNGRTDATLLAEARTALQELHTETGQSPTRTHSAMHAMLVILEGLVNEAEIAADLKSARAAMAEVKAELRPTVRGADGLEPLELITYRFLGFVYASPNAVVYVSFCPRLKIYTQGRTELEARDALGDAVQMFLRSCQGRGILENTLRSHALDSPTEVGTRSSEPKRFYVHAQLPMYPTPEAG